MPVLARKNLQLQVSIDQVVLLQAPEPLPDLSRAHRPDAVHSLEIAMAGPDDRVERAEVAHDLADDRLGKPRHLREHAVAARLDRQVERVHVFIDEWLPQHRRFRYAYEVVDPASPNYEAADKITSSIELRAGHVYNVRLSMENGHPEIVELISEVEG